MYTNLYVAEKLHHQRHQELVEQAACNRIVAQVSNLKTTRSQTMKRMKLIAAAILVAATLVGPGAWAFTASDGSVPAVASMCCFTKQ
jgi:hypothetical protein